MGSLGSNPVGPLTPGNAGVMPGSPGEGVKAGGGVIVLDAEAFSSRL